MGDLSGCVERPTEQLRWDFHECKGGHIDLTLYGHPWIKVSDNLQYQVVLFEGVDNCPQFAMNLDGTLYKESETK